MLRDQDFRMVLKLTVAYALVGAVLIVMQPVEGRTATAVAGGNFEVPLAGVSGYFYQLASAE